MTSVVFDTLKFAQRLETGGFTEQQARTAATALNESLAADAISRAYLDVKLAELDHRLIELEQRVVIKLGGMILALAGFLTAIKYWG